MRVVAVNGSARRGGNTLAMIEAALAPLRAAGHDGEVVELGGRELRGCGRTSGTRSCPGSSRRTR